MHSQAWLKHDKPVQFPVYSGVRCLMMPYIQGDSSSVPWEYHAYREIIESVYLAKGEIGYLTIDESHARQGTPHRGQRAKWNRALHTEAGIRPGGRWGWGDGPSWGGGDDVTLDSDVRILLANNLDESCAVWPVEHPDTSRDGDIGDKADLYPYAAAIYMKAGEVHEIGILTPHESLPVRRDVARQFLRIVGAGVHGREPYFTVNPLLAGDM